jgi:Cof subfamily protein (haloacid dehalogenase superfamily)
VDNPFKIVFFDIDWTLYDHKNHCWPASALASIHALQAKGIKVVLCTARPFHSMDKFGTNNLGIVWDGYISSAGGVAYADHQYLRKSLMKEADIVSFTRAVKARNLTMELVEPIERKLVFPQTYSSRKFYAAFNEVVPPRGVYQGEEVVGINFFAAKKWDREMMRLFPQLVYSRYFDYAVDVMPVQHLKGQAVADVLHHYGFTKAESLGFGDDLQDISLADNVGKFVCMGNGKDEVKQHASYVTSAVWDNGVLQGLRYFGLVD